MIRRAVERVYSVVSANFNTDFAALAAAAGVPAVTADFYKRLAAPGFWRKTTAGVGVYHGSGASERRKAGAAAGSGVRDTRVDVVLDWWIRGHEPDVLAVQTEIAIDALVRSIDRVPDEASGVWSAADARDSITWTIERSTLTDEGRIATERAIVVCPLRVRDTGL